MFVLHIGFVHNYEIYLWLWCSVFWVYLLVVSFRSSSDYLAVKLLISYWWSITVHSFQMNEFEWHLYQLNVFELTFIFTEWVWMAFIFAEWNEWMNDWCYRPRFCTVRLYWAGDNLGEWDWLRIMPLVQDQPLNPLTSSPYYHCTTDAPFTEWVWSTVCMAFISNE